MTMTNQKFKVLPNLRLKIHYDQHSESPRDWDNIGTMVFRAGDDNPAGDDDPVPSFRDLLNDLCEFDDDYNDRDCWLQEKIRKGVNVERAAQQIRDYLDAELLREFNQHHVAFALSYHAERGSTTVMPTAFTADDLDDADGIIYVSRDELREQNINSGDAAESLRIECQTYSQWLSEDVYGFVIQDDDESIHDSCGGFFGSDFETNGMKDQVPEELWPQLVDPTVHS